MSPEVPESDCVGGFLTTDDGPPGAIQAHRHRRHVETPIAPPCHEDRMLMFTETLLGDGNSHRYPPSLELRTCCEGGQPTCPCLAKRVAAMTGEVPAEERQGHAVVQRERHQCRRHGPMEDKGRGIFLVDVDIDAQHDQACNAWYNTEHL